MPFHKAYWPPLYLKFCDLSPPNFFNVPSFHSRVYMPSTYYKRKNENGKKEKKTAEIYYYKVKLF